MYKCSKCNYVTEDNITHCPNCGNKLNKSINVALIFAIVSVVCVIIGVNIVINVISIICSIVSIVLLIIKRDINKWALGLSIFSILGSSIWILFNFVH